MTDEPVTIRVDDEALTRQACASFGSQDIDAAPAGMVRDADSPNEDALAMAHEIAGKSLRAVRGAKSLLNASPCRGVAEQFENERRMRSAQRQEGGSPDSRTPIR